MKPRGDEFGSLSKFRRVTGTKGPEVSTREFPIKSPVSSNRDAIDCKIPCFTGTKLAWGGSNIPTNRTSCWGGIMKVSFNRTGQHVSVRYACNK